ncbi:MULTISPECIES: EscU/YscU/HrcU family type III secretion system export apparatus switch protein [Sanguibacter]|uniref:EscU/YscU/HrcU family type III secretion system export apparatus switch protein n=1 Tax=Sanguibacter inulinus TaxID=60922 RepID=A0A853EXR3_9MICO|nr:MULTISPECIES: EscU/YscU/HrcU family type III secretion system export apparatus switch protein [Sanguibacter]MBF0723479.1 EscU/YscU/HrcU family type III secretion system export apparatus switch protein [Sanguibacter inulinus]NYS94624.1 EscU/YscU/HrcU family type III secretion system export apparatus switch protein [Sanguibacter inulinus]
MSGGGDSGEKTEQATPKRMKQNRKDGSLQKSQDLSSWLGIGAAAVMLPVVLGRGASAAVDQLSAVRDVVANPDPLVVVDLLGRGLDSILDSVTPMLIVVVIAAIVANVAQGGLHIATKKLKPRVDQFNLLKGVKNTFGGQALWQGVKALTKTVVVGAVLYIAVQNLMPVLLTAGGLSVGALLSAAGGGITSLLWSAVAAGLGLAVLDLVVVMKRNRKKTRMSLYEVKQENKQSEGDPQLKGAIRSKQIAMSRNRMIASVGDADVVLVNPTHVAVALKYEAGTGAPRVVAKGAGHVAARIREVAAEKKVPMISDVPLARALHGACEIGEEIPADLYAAVAQVLAFVMALKRRGGSTDGVRTMPGPTIPAPPPGSPPPARRTRASRTARPADSPDPQPDTDPAPGTSTLSEARA